MYDGALTRWETGVVIATGGGGGLIFEGQLGKNVGDFTNCFYNSNFQKCIFSLACMFGFLAIVLIGGDGVLDRKVFGGYLIFLYFLFWG